MTTLATQTLEAPIVITEPGVWRGRGIGSVLTVTYAEGPVFDIQAPGVTIEGFDIQSAVPRTGPYLDIRHNRVTLRDIFFRGSYVGVNVGSPTCQPAIPRIIDCDFIDPVVAPGAGAISMQNFAGATISRVSICGPGVGTQPDFGIRATRGDTLIISDSNITKHGFGLLGCPPDGAPLTAISASNTFFDSAGLTASGHYGSAVWLVPYGTIQSVKFTGCWLGLSFSWGLLVSPLGSGGAHQIRLGNCDLPGNGLGEVRLAGNCTGVWRDGEVLSPTGQGQY